MNNCCKELRLRSHKYKKYLYCAKRKENINFEDCKCCKLKKYKNYTKKITVISNKSIMPEKVIINSNGVIIIGFNHRIPGYHKHHVFEGKNRNNSEKYGLYIWLKWSDHVLNGNSIHCNPEITKKLHKIAQKEFEKKYDELDFLKIFGRNFL